jgi:hypothetical protein
VHVPTPAFAGSPTKQRCFVPSVHGHPARSFGLPQLASSRASKIGAESACGGSASPLRTPESRDVDGSSVVGSSCPPLAPHAPITMHESETITTDARVREGTIMDDPFRESATSSVARPRSSQRVCRGSHMARARSEHAHSRGKRNRDDSMDERAHRPRVTASL